MCCLGIGSDGGRGSDFHHRLTNESKTNYKCKGRELREVVAREEREHTLRSAVYHQLRPAVEMKA